VTERRARPFFFCHLQKTAGSSLIRRLRRHFGEDRVYPNEHEATIARNSISIPDLLARWNERGGGLDLIAGHFPLCTQEILGGDFLTFTILREPVARTLSYLQHHRRLTPADRDKTLEEIYDNRFRFNAFVHNHMVKMLSLTVDEMTRGAMTRVAFTHDRVERAKRQLAAVDVVGVQERFDEFCAALSARFGFRLGAPVFVNRTEPVLATPAFRRRIAEDNALDVELYEAASELAMQRERAQQV
jgi:hypothetical protein